MKGVGVEPAKNARNRAMGGGVAAGVLVGLGVGVTINNLPPGIAIGTGLSVAIGAAPAGKKSG